MSDERLDEIIRSAARDYHVPKATPREELWARIDASRRSTSPGSMHRMGHSTLAWGGLGIAAVLLLGIKIGRMLERRQALELASMVAGRTSPPIPGERSTGAPAPESPRDSAQAAATPAAAHAGEPVDAGMQRRSGPLGDVASGNRATAGDRAITTPGDDATASGEPAYRLAMLQHMAGTEAMLLTFGAEAKSGEVDARLASWARDLLRTTHLLQASPVASNDPTLGRLLDDLELVLLQIAQYRPKSPRRTEELELIQRSIDKRGVMAKLRATGPAAPMPAGT